MFHLSNKRVKATNLKCLYRTDILSDFSDPEMKVDLNDGRTVRFKSGKISTVELLNHLNKIVLPLVVVKDTTITETKAAKLAAGGGHHKPVDKKKKGGGRK